MTSRDTWLDIDVDALLDNYNELKKAANTAVFAVVKANAYGHGDVEISKVLSTTDTPFLCVSSLDEANYLYQHGIDHDVLIFGYVDPDSIVQGHKANFVYTISSESWCRKAVALGLNVRVHLEVNTGMNRVGIKDIQTIKEIVTDYKVEGIYTHFQSPDDLEAGHQQMRRFNEVLAALDVSFQWLHLGNAPISIVKENPHINGSRFGLGMYGYRIDLPGLKPVMSLYTKIVHTDTMEEGETLGYDYTYTATQTTRFATVAIGYADGFDPRQAVLPVVIREKAYPIIGKICMDQCMIHIDDAVQVGDVVTLMGPGRTTAMIDQATLIMPYIQLSSLSPRIRRDYYRKQKCYASQWR